MVDVSIATKWRTKVAVVGVVAFVPA